MGMSTHIVGFRKRDAQWDKMLNIYNACAEADISCPKEVYAFFEGVNDPNSAPGASVQIENTEAVTEYNENSGSGYEVDITKLPKGVKFIRFFNAW